MKEKGCSTQFSNTYLNSESLPTLLKHSSIEPSTEKYTMCYSKVDFFFSSVILPKYI